MRSVEDACGDGLSDKMLCACERYRCTYIEREVLTFYIHIDGQRQNQIQKQKQRERQRTLKNHNLSPREVIKNTLNKEPRVKFVCYIHMS